MAWIGKHTHKRRKHQKRQQKVMTPKQGMVIHKLLREAGVHRGVGSNIRLSIRKAEGDIMGKQFTLEAEDGSKLVIYPAHWEMYEVEPVQDSLVLPSPRKHFKDRGKFYAYIRRWIRKHTHTLLPNPGHISVGDKVGSLVRGEDWQGVVIDKAISTPVYLGLDTTSGIDAIVKIEGDKKTHRIPIEYLKKIRSNPSPRVKALRAKYRKKYGNDWWQDDDIKEEFIEEKRGKVKKAATKKKGKSTKKSRAKVKDTSKITRLIRAREPAKIASAFGKVLNKLEELPDRYHNDTGLYYDHVIDVGGIMLKIVLKDIATNKRGFKGRPRLNVDFTTKNIEIIDSTLGGEGGGIKTYNLTSTTAAFNYIKKWIESNL